MNKPTIDQEYAHTKASSITKAYTIISSPVHRSKHLIQLLSKKNDFDNEELETGELVGKEFLMCTMEIHEDIEDADDKQLKSIQENNMDAINTLINDLTKAFDSSDIELCKKLSAQLRYLV